MRKFLTVLLISCMISGCATAPKPKTVGEVVGSVVDSTISWTSQGIQKILNK